MVRKTVNQIINNHVSYELECIDRMYLNGYVPRLQTGAAAAFFIRQQFDCTMASTSKLEPMTKQFIESIKQFVDDEQLELIGFKKGERKDDIAKQYLAEYEEGVMFVGKAQEKAKVFRTERRRSETGATYPWLFRSTAMVNQLSLIHI